MLQIIHSAGIVNRGEWLGCPANIKLSIFEIKRVTTLIYLFELKILKLQSGMDIRVKILCLTLTLVIDVVFNVNKSQCQAQNFNSEGHNSNNHHYWILRQS